MSPDTPTDMIMAAESWSAFAASPSFGTFGAAVVDGVDGVALLTPWVPAGGGRIANRTSKLAFKTGKEGENYLFHILGGETQKFINTPQGRRFIDVFYDGVAHESKVGYASLTKFIKKQIQKDVYARDVLGEVDEVVRHFFESGVTGKKGPSEPLRDYLIENGIGIVIH